MKRKCLVTVLLLCLILSMTACAPADENALPEGVSYAIKVVDTAGNPVVGAMVSLCQDKEGGTCYMPAATNEGGIAYFYSNMVPAQNQMKVRVLSAQGYALPLDENGEIRYTSVPNGANQLTLTLEQLQN